MRRPLALAVAALALAGCSAFHSEDELRSVLSKDSVLLPVPQVAQEGPGACGLACLASLLRYHGLELDDEARRRFPDEASRRGSIAAGEIRDYLRARGLRAYLVHGTLDATPPRGVLALLAESVPVLVALKLKESEHYALVCGFDRERRWMLLMDPARGFAALPFDDFDACWRGAERLMLVAAPARQ